MKALTSGRLNAVRGEAFGDQLRVEVLVGIGPVRELLRFVERTVEVVVRNATLDDH